MPRRGIEDIRDKIRLGDYDMSLHAMEEMAEDGLAIKALMNKQYKQDMYGYRCEYCQGTVRPRTLEREVFKHKKGFIILEDVTIGVCDICGNRYYCADILHAVHEIAMGIRPPERREQVPVAHGPMQVP